MGISRFCGWPFLAFACSLSISAAAAPISWFLDGVTFDDGGTASGSFVYDASTNAFSNIAIATTAGSIRSGSPYSAPTGIGTATIADFVDPDLPVLPGVSERLILFLAAAMTDAGGTISFTQANEFTCLDFACSYVTGNEPGLDLRAAISVNESRSAPST